MKTCRNAVLFKETAFDFLAGFLIFLVVFGLATLDPRAAWPAPANAAVIEITHESADTPNHRLSIGHGGTLAAPSGETDVSVDAWIRSSQEVSPVVDDTSKGTAGQFNTAESKALKLAQAHQAARQGFHPSLYGPQLPKGAMLDHRTFWVTAMALLFAAMCAVTLGFWRHLRRVCASPRRIRRGI